ncbi:aldo/keto reductase [Blyttiomyces helicus]|uniref:Aldo/keto reductase n=1 Tax=Blyttiomyces helicus TaxID=388810 RepID=A0A4P9WBI0_9FUNG|nr:aldo/keto reductase [Blyttiomyces helicus]|eukprot:RKO87646.1 aldo/keto reductase [Blyttiomyces helicus]
MCTSLDDQPGKNGPEVSALGFGAMGLYGANENERLIGRVLATRRSEVFLCTEFGVILGPNGVPAGISGSADYVRQSCEASLKRLNTDYIELYYVHRIDPNTPIEETVGAMAELVKEGKIHHLGLSESSVSTLRRAHAVHPIAAIQVEYSPWEVSIEDNGLLAACCELGVAIVAYSPLGAGFLTGKFRSADELDPNDRRRASPRFQGENFAKNVEIALQFKKLSEAKGVSASQLVLGRALGWGNICLFFNHLEDNLAANQISHSDEDDGAIRDLIKQISVAGTRYAEAGMKPTSLDPDPTKLGANRVGSGSNGVGSNELGVPALLDPTKMGLWVRDRQMDSRGL